VASGSPDRATAPTPPGGASPAPPTTDRDHPPGVRAAVADGVVCELLRVASLSPRQERREFGAVAGECAGASLGGSVAAYSFVVVQREGCLQDFGWWS
jgi:hypothetical protein